MVKNRRASGEVIKVPWEMESHEINDLSLVTPQLAETLKKVKEDSRLKQRQRIKDKLVDFGIPEEDLPTINNPEDAFNYVLKGANRLHQQVVSLDEALTYEKGINKRLQELKKDKKQAEQNRTEAEKKFMKSLEIQVGDLFFKLRNIEDDSERKKSVSTSKMLIKGYLKSQFGQEGYSIAEDLTGLKVTFTDSTVAMLFAKELGEWEKDQKDEFAKKYGELQVKYQTLKKNLRKKGLSDTVIDSGMSEEIALAKQMRVNEVSIVDELRRGGEETVKGYLPQIKELARVKFELEKLEKENIFPNLRKFEDSREKIGYIGNETESLRSSLEMNQEQFKQFIEEAETTQRETNQYKKRAQNLEKRIVGYSRTLFKGFRTVGKFLEDNKIKHKLGYTKVNGKEATEYFNIILKEFKKMADTIGHLVKRHTQLKGENKGLIENQKLMDSVKEMAEKSVAEVTSLQRILKTYQNPEDEKRRKALGKRILDLQNVLQRYLFGFDVEEKYGNISQRMTNGNEEHFINNHYLGILEDAITLTETEILPFQEMTDSLVDVEEEKQALAQKYNCETVEDLTERVTQINKDIELTKTKKRVEKELEDFKNQARIKPKTSEKAQEHFKNYQKDQDAAKDILKKLYKGKAPDHETVLEHSSEFNTLYHKLDEISKAEDKVIESAVDLNPKKDTLQKAKNLVKAVNRQVKEYQKHKAANQKITQSEQYEGYTDRFRVLSKIGPILKTEISTPNGLVEVLKAEKDYWSESLKVYQGKKVKDAQRLGL